MILQAGTHNFLMYEAKRSKFDHLACQTKKNEWGFQDNATKKEFGILYDALKCAKLPLSTGHNAVYGLEYVVLVLLYMCKNGATANRAVTEMSPRSEMTGTSASR